ncbi:MAG: oligosaccharide flippase family protein, partial [Hyphomicrobiales bacterium]
MSPRSLGENLAALASAQLLTWVITGATLAILPRYLGPADFGRLTLGITLAAFASTFAGLGLPTLVTKLVARDGREAGDAVLSALLITLVTSVLAAVGLMLALPVLGYGPRTQAVVGLSLLAVPVVLVGMIGASILQGFQVMRVQALLDVGGKLGTLIALAAVIVTGTGVIAYATANAVLTVAGALPMIAVALRAVGIRGRRANRVREVVVAGLPLYTTDVFLVLYMTTDLVLLSLLATEREVGLYAAPMRIFGTLLFLPNVVAVVLFPRLAHAHRSDPDHFLTVSYWSLVCVWLAAIPISL